MKPTKERTILQTAEEVIELLRIRYPENQYAFLEQVGDGTGMYTRRHADAVVMGLWPSRGLEIIGIEVKVRRSDWLKELQIPEKAEAIAKYCDRWYIAVGDEEIVKDGELPKNWGLIVPKKDGLRVKVEAKLAEPEPVPSRSFLAAVLRQTQNQLTDAARLKAEYDKGFQEGAKAEKSKNWYKTDLESLQKKVAAFEKASGLEILRGWNEPAAIGQAVRQILNGTAARTQEQLEKLHGQALRIANSIEDELKKDL